VPDKFRTLAADLVTGERVVDLLSRADDWAARDLAVLI
jgi:hypothetical protein